MAQRNRVWRPGVIGIALLVMTVPVTGGLSGAAAADESTTAVDIVFVFDNSQSTNEDRYHMAQEMGGLDRSLDRDGIDARYGLVTYNGTVRTEQRLTGDFDEFDRSMHFDTGGSEEVAADAVLTATELSFRDDAETVVVLVTDEDDDSSNATREAATAELADVQFIAVSPADAEESSCAVHSPPCDNRSDNELRTVTETVGGTWLDEAAAAETTVDRIEETIPSAVGATGSDDRSGSDPVDGSTDDTTAPRTGSDDGSDGHPAFETVSLSANRTTAEVGDPVRINKTVENTGSAAGVYGAYLSHGGSVVAARTVRIPARTNRTITFVHTFERTGQYETLVSHEPAATINVTPPRTAEVDTVIRSDGTGLETTVADARANGSVTIPTDAADLATPGVASVENVTVSVGDANATPAHDVAFALDLTATATAPDGVAPLPDTVNRSTYLTVNGSLDTFESVAFEYVAASETTTLYRDDANASGWVPVERVSTDGNRIRTAASNGTTFAIGVRQPDIEVTDLRVEERSVPAGETTTVTATVGNDGAAAGDYDATLTADGRVVDGGQVTVPAGETRRLTIEYAPDRAGTHTMAVGGESRTLRVEPATAAGGAAATATSGDEARAPVRSGPNRPTAVIPVVLALLLLGLVVRRRR